MTVDVDEAILSGEPFKAGDRWFRCVVERPGLMRLTWGPVTSWADWDALDFVILADTEVPAMIIQISKEATGGC
jgi:hypothetical protein